MNASVEIIKKYFPNLSAQQEQQFSLLLSLYGHWNERINLISRKDMVAFYERHVLHSLSIAKCVAFAPASKVLDVGTGGGFPGIPLAILFPHCHFTLVDSIGKKIMAVSEIAKTLQLQNVTPLNMRAEQLTQKFDFIVSRAVTNLPVFLSWVGQKVAVGNKSNLRNGILCLKGGALEEELNPVTQKVQIFDISSWFDEAFFETKKIVYLTN